MKTLFENRSFILIVASIAFICFSAVLIANLVGTAVEKKNEYDILAQQLADQTKENEELEKELKQGISNEEKMYIARNELGYILPGERVYADAS